MTDHNGSEAAMDRRDPDPTIDAIEPNALIGLDYSYGDPPIAHTVRWIRPEHVPECADPVYGGVETISARFARWFAVPCRVCFDAPPPGHPGTDLDCPAWTDCTHDHPYLAWQVQS